jgi:hypothetical protein
MAKKAFTNNFEDIFSSTVEQKSSVKEPSNQKSFLDSDIAIQRTTILLQKSTYDTIKAIAHWERVQIKDLLDNALQAIISTYSAEQLQTMRNEHIKKTR